MTFRPSFSSCATSRFCWASVPRRRCTQSASNSRDRHDPCHDFRERGQHHVDRPVQLGDRRCRTGRSGPAVAGSCAEPVPRTIREYLGVVFSVKHRLDCFPARRPSSSEATDISVTQQSCMTFSSRCTARVRFSIVVRRCRARSRNARIGVGGTNDGRTRPCSTSCAIHPASVTSVFRPGIAMQMPRVQQPVFERILHHVVIPVSHTPQWIPSRPATPGPPTASWSGWSARLPSWGMSGPPAGACRRDPESAPPPRPCPGARPIRLPG